MSKPGADSEKHREAWTVIPGCSRLIRYKSSKQNSPRLSKVIEVQLRALSKRRSFAAELQCKGSYPLAGLIKWSNIKKWQAAANCANYALIVFKTRIEENALSIMNSFEKLIGQISLFSIKSL